jgi:hypothetical protein
MKAIAETTDGRDDLSFGIAEFATDFADLNIHHSRGRCLGIELPDIADQVIAGDNFSAMLK